jgi:hypothetical protein
MFTEEGFGALNKYENLRHDLSHKSCHKLNLMNTQSQIFAPYHHLHAIPATPHTFYQWRTQEFFFFGGGEVSTNSVEDRGQNGDLGGGSPLVRGSGGSCNLVQEITFHIVKFS